MKWKKEEMSMKIMKWRNNEGGGMRMIMYK